MVLDLLTDLDKKRILNYIRTNIKEPECDIDTILQHWNNAKSNYLADIFKDKLIIKEPIVYKEDQEVITRKVMDLMYEDTRINSFKCGFLYAIKTLIAEKEELKERDIIETRTYNLFNINTLAKNQIIFKNIYGSLYGYWDSTKKQYEFELNSQTIKVQDGAKPMRIIEKIAKAINVGVEVPEGDTISDFEYFRRKHSVCLNQKQLKGTMCLSIHPLDYMTMSDNAEGWGSCMSWTEGGEYKAGTVEMMNSTSVVVAYLASEKRDFCFGGYVKDKEENTWNSKKWRCLFIVNDHFIINVKSYPYYNPTLEKEALRQLTKLCGWDNAEIINYEPEYNQTVTIGDREVALSFETNTMYCDLDNTCSNFIALNPKETDKIDMCYNYSGVSECMVCGYTDDYGEMVGYDEACLVCRRCDDAVLCECCDSNHATQMTNDGYELCGYCMENCTFYDEVFDEVYYHYDDSEIINIELSQSNEKLKYSSKYYQPQIRTLKGNVDMNCPTWKYYFKTDELHYDEELEQYYLGPDDCTEDGLKKFGIYDLQHFLSLK